MEQELTLPGPPPRHVPPMLFMAQWYSPAAAWLLLLSPPAALLLATAVPAASAGCAAALFLVLLSLGVAGRRRCALLRDGMAVPIDVESVQEERVGGEPPYLTRRTLRGSFEVEGHPPVAVRACGWDHEAAVLSETWPLVLCDAARPARHLVFPQGFGPHYNGSSRTFFWEADGALVVPPGTRWRVATLSLGIALAVLVLAICLSM